MLSKNTAHSEYGELAKVFLWHLEGAFKSQEYIDKNWEELNYLAKPEYIKAVDEYNRFGKIIKSLGCDIEYFKGGETDGMDSIYCRDASIATDYGTILCNMGKGQRANEPKHHQSKYTELGIKILGSINAPGTLEGGDVAWIDQRTLIVGNTYRSNAEGIRQLKELLEPFDIRVIDVQMPHYKGPSDVFHLMSILKIGRAHV